MTNYGVAPYTPNYARTQQGALARRASTGAAVVDPNAPPTTWEKTKAWFDETTLSVPRKYLAGGAVALGVIYYGHTAGWFGKSGKKK